MQLDRLRYCSEEAFSCLFKIVFRSVAAIRHKILNSFEEASNLSISEEMKILKGTLDRLKYPRETIIISGF